MEPECTPMGHLLARIKVWCGVTIEPDEKITLVKIKDRVIARFPSSDSLEVVLCGSIRDQVLSDPEELPEGMWLRSNGHDVVIVDLTAPRGMEEAIRILLNAYIASQTSDAVTKWWMDEEHLMEDPTCEKLEQIIREHRAVEGRLAS